MLCKHFALYGLPKAAVTMFPKKKFRFLAPN